jgi:aminoglycoside phosphotransferase (APT) family kinase protein
VEEVRARIERELRYEPVLLHGDAHFRNCFFTAQGPIWADLEDACLAPPEWDAACLANTTRLDGGDPEHERALEQLEIPSLERFELLRILRVIVGIVWVTFTRGAHPDTDRRIEWLRANAP